MNLVYNVLQTYVSKVKDLQPYFITSELVIKESNYIRILDDVEQAGGVQDHKQSYLYIRLNTNVINYVINAINYTSADNSKYVSLLLDVRMGCVHWERENWIVEQAVRQVLGKIDTCSLFRTVGELQTIQVIPKSCIVSTRDALISEGYRNDIGIPPGFGVTLFDLEFKLQLTPKCASIDLCNVTNICE